MEIEIRIETADEFDPAATASLARQAFARHGPELSADRFSWTYRRGYDRAVIVAAFADGAKVGQLACFFKPFFMEGRETVAAELVDLFVSPDFRGFKVASRLYKEMKKVVAAAQAEVLFAYANEGASVLNRRFFGMEEVTQLPARLGLAALLRSGGSGNRISIHREKDRIVEACLGCVDRIPPGGVVLSADQLQSRIGSPVHGYVCATDGETAVLASPRVIRSVPLLLIPACFSGHRSPDRPSVGALIRELCRTTGRSTFLYAGWNDLADIRNGFSVPDRLLKGKFLIQSNCLNSRRKDIERFELLDVDYG